MKIKNVKISLILKNLYREASNNKKIGTNNVLEKKILSGSKYNIKVFELASYYWMRDYAKDYLKMRKEFTAWQKEGIGFILHAKYTFLGFNNIDQRILSVLEKDLRLAKMLKIKTVVAHTRYDVFYNRTRQDYTVYHLLTKMDRLAQKYNIKIGLENMDGCAGNLKFILKKIKEAKCKKLGLTVDFGHAFMDRYTVDFMCEAILQAKNKLFHIHAHENDGQFDNHAALGSHNFNWQKVFRALNKIGYKNYFTLEICDEKGLVESISYLKGL